MIITNQRVAETKNSTQGILWLDNKPIGYVTEDGFREKKVAGETRIPAGKYQLKIRAEMTPLTKKYRSRFPWFRYHIELQDVPDFSYVYIHIGNTKDDTEACQIIGRDGSVQNGEFVNKYSTDMFEEFYKTIYPALEGGVKIWYEVKDIKY